MFRNLTQFDCFDLRERVRLSQTHLISPSEKCLHTYRCARVGAGEESLAVWRIHLEVNRYPLYAEIAEASHRRIDCLEGGRSVRCASALVARGVEAKHTRAAADAFAESIRHVQSYRTELEVRRDVLPQIQTPETGTR